MCKDARADGASPTQAADPASARITRRRALAGLAATWPAACLARMVGGAPAAQASPMLLQPVPGRPVAPSFSLPDIDGAARTLAEFRGRVLVANFWATWCPPCRAEIPSMQRAWLALEAQGAQMLALHVGGNPDEIWAFLAEFGVTFPVLIDVSGSVSRDWQTIGLPTTYVVDGEGRMVYRAIGERAWDDPVILGQILALKEQRI